MITALEMVVVEDRENDSLSYGHGKSLIVSHNPVKTALKSGIKMNFNQDMCLRMIVSNKQQLYMLIQV